MSGLSSLNQFRGMCNVEGLEAISTKNDLLWNSQGDNILLH